MERKKTAIKEKYSELDEMLGTQDCIVDCFPNKKKRLVSPITLDVFSEFMSNLMIINHETLWTNYLQEDTEQAVTKVIEMSFPNEKDILKDITAVNFPVIIKKILEVNGVKISEDDNSTEKKME